MRERLIRRVFAVVRVGVRIGGKLASFVPLISTKLHKHKTPVKLRFSRCFAVLPTILLSLLLFLALPPLSRYGNLCGNRNDFDDVL